MVVTAAQILIVACASRAFNPQHVQLASDITEGEIGSGHCGDSYAALTMGGKSCLGYDFGGRVLLSSLG